LNIESQSEAVMTKRPKEILDFYRSENAGVLSNIARVTNHGRLAAIFSVALRRQPFLRCIACFSPRRCCCGGGSGTRRSRLDGAMNLAVSGTTHIAATPRSTMSPINYERSHQHKTFAASPTLSTETGYLQWEGSPRAICAYSNSSRWIPRALRPPQQLFSKLIGRP
jgi:hypothetical protein